MGREQRAKRAARAAGQTTTAGNPEAFRPTATVISQEKWDEAYRGGARQMTVRFSDRQYVMDVHGTLRRVNPTPSVTFTRA